MHDFLIVFSEESGEAPVERREPVKLSDKDDTWWATGGQRERTIHLFTREYIVIWKQYASTTGVFGVAFHRFSFFSKGDAQELADPEAFCFCSGSHLRPF